MIHGDAQELGGAGDGKCVDFVLGEREAIDGFEAGE